MKLKAFTFVIVSILLLASGDLYAQASSQREVRITNPTNSNYISFLSPSGANAPPSTYSLILPTTVNPSGSSLLFGTGTGNLTWTSGGSNGQVLTISGGVPTWATPASAGNYVNYDVGSTQAASVVHGNNLFNVSYAAGATGTTASGAVITSSVGAVANASATGLTITSTGSGTGSSTGLLITASGGATNTGINATGNTIGVAATGNTAVTATGTATGVAAIGTTAVSAVGSATGVSATAPTAVAATGNVNLLSASGVASSLSLQNPAGTFATSFVAGAQTADITYTLPTAAPSAGSLLYSTGGASSTLTWAPSGTNGQFLMLSSGVPAWGNAVMYDVTAAQSTMTDRTHYLFNVAYSGTASDANSAGAVITSAAGPTNGTATGLTITAAGTGLGNATGLSVTATGGTVKTAIAATGNVNILSAGGSANTLGLQNPAGTFTSYFKAGAQNADFTYTLPTALPAANGYALTANTSGVLSWSAVSGGSGSGWLTTGNSGLTDNTSNFLGTLDNTPIRFVTGSSGAPNTKMVLDQTGDILLGSASGTTTFTSATGRMAIGDALSTARLNSVPTIGTNVFNMIDANAGLRVWRYATNAGNSDPSIDLIGGTNDNQGNSANQWWTISSTGTPGTANSGTNSTGEHLTFRRRSGSVDSEFVSIFAGGNVGIGGNGSGAITAPANRLTVTTTDAVTNTSTDVVAIQHNSSGTPAASFGTGLAFRGKSSSTINRSMGQIRTVWDTATDATRMASMTFSTDSMGTDREKVRIGGNGYVGFNQTNPGVRVDINGGYATKSRTVTVNSGTNDNIAVGDCAYLRIDAPGAFTINGLQAGIDGQRLRIVDINGWDMTIGNNASSTTANNIETDVGSDVIVRGTQPILDMTYDSGLNKWLLGTLNANQIIGGVGSIIYAYKTKADTVKAISGNMNLGTTLISDPHLKVNINPNQTWEVQGALDISEVNGSGNNGGFEAAFTLQAGDTMRVFFTGAADAGGNNMQGAGILKTSGTPAPLGIITGKHTLAIFEGIIITNSTSGTHPVQFKWAQDVTNNNAPNTNGTILGQYSYFKLSRIK
ncbi:MAG TPA: hypothetical protein VFO76_13650 [Candidatus Kapabacteria bacterium]|nr:hypothetical protein [Candidatus Kapabacteria bacterium]